MGYGCAGVTSNKDLKHCRSSGLVMAAFVAFKLNHREAIRITIFDGPAATLGLVSGSVLLLRLSLNHELDLAVGRRVGVRLEEGHAVDDVVVGDHAVGVGVVHAAVVGVRRPRVGRGNTAVLPLLTRVLFQVGVGLLGHVHVGHESVLVAVEKVAPEFCCPKLLKCMVRFHDIFLGESG